MHKKRPVSSVQLIGGMAVLFVSFIFFGSCILFFAWQTTIPPACEQCGDQFLLSELSLCRNLALLFYGSIIATGATILGMAALIVRWKTTRLPSRNRDSSR